ncbi:hypothetical protein [Muribaculum intestinale]|jgi:hypothetical protein|uniref:hypothetical protein n=1 Tax=Muribaculum intestinale TaxID=1796646 RepID=UPI0025A5FC46|nr:hypothetical protein [Muribaculum intestinale]MCX4294449.1 hypothetical protein [Prevotella sp.]
MKKIFAILLVSFLMFTFSSVASAEEPTQRVYAELLGTGTNFLNLNKNVKVSVDLGQFQSATKAYTLLDENGKDIKFNSMVAAMNYMGERGWKFVQAYVVTVSNQNVLHWLLYKDITDPAQIKEGLNVKNMD